MSKFYSQHITAVKSVIRLVPIRNLLKFIVRHVKIKNTRITRSCDGTAIYITPRDTAVSSKVEAIDDDAV